MGMKLKSGADLCGFQLTNFCVQGEASAPSDAALGRKYFHTNATDDVATGISLLHRERIYLGEGAWRATAYLDDIAAINEKLNLITGDTDTDTLINNLKDLEEFLKDFSETDKLKSLLDGKLSTSGGTMTGNIGYRVSLNQYWAAGIVYKDSSDSVLAQIGAYSNNSSTIDRIYLGFGTGVWNGENALVIERDKISFNKNPLIHSGNIGSQKVAGLAAPVTIWGQSFDGTGDIANNTTGTMRRLLFHDTFNDSGTTGYIGKASSSNNDVYVNSTHNLRLMSGDNYTMWLNSSGNVTIGGSDLAGTSAKLYVDGGSLRGFNFNSNSVGGPIIQLLYNNNASSWWGYSPTLNGVFLFNKNDTGILINDNNNVLIGTRTDSGQRLQVYGAGYFNQYNASGNKSGASIIINKGGDLFGMGTASNVKHFALGYVDFAGVWKSEVMTFKGNNVHIKGNLIVDGEVSAGGAGAEESTSGSGSAEGVSEIFTPTSTSMVFNHNLGEDVIVQVYEKSGNVWNMVIVDTEITSATRVTLRFGKTETTQHKVVIMGV